MAGSRRQKESIRTSASGYMPAASGYMPASSYCNMHAASGYMPAGHLNKKQKKPEQFFELLLLDCSM